MTRKEIQNLRPGHPMNLNGLDERVYYRSARFSPHSGSFLVCVATDSGGILAAEPEDLSPIADES